VIARIATDGQYRLADDNLQRLNEIDEEAQTAVEAGDQEGLQRLLERMAELVRSEGEPLGDDELVESEVIIPPTDSTIEELAHAFEDEGLIPG
jgi:ABC-type transporter Mla subunit MlaD